MKVNEQLINFIKTLNTEFSAIFIYHDKVEHRSKMELKSAITDFEKLNLNDFINIDLYSFTVHDYFTLHVIDNDEKLKKYYNC